MKTYFISIACVWLVVAVVAMFAHEFAHATIFGLIAIFLRVHAADTR